MAKEQRENNELQNLKTALREKRADRLYIFFGEETFLLHHYLNQLKKLLVDPITESFNYHKLTKENFDVRALADAVESLPMMAEHTFVWVDDIDIFKLPEDDRAKIGELLGDIGDYCTVVFTFETVTWKPDKRLKKLWDPIQANGRIVEFPKQEYRDLIAWVGRHFAANGKQIQPQLCSYLIDITGGTMTALTGEIAKICAYSDSDTIVKEDIDAVTEPVIDAVAFQMTDLLAAGEYGKALEKLDQLFKLQHEPLAILGAMGVHFRRLSAARTLMDNGKNASDLAQLTGLRDYPARKTMESARRFSARFCAAAAEMVLETDLQLKTSYDEPERLLEMLIMRLAQEARNG
mgnify:CR=1 FL=1